MGIAFQRLCNVNSQRLLLIMGMIVAAMTVFQFFELHSANYILSLAPAEKVSILMTVKNATLIGNARSTNSYVVDLVANNTNIFYSEEESRYQDVTLKKSWTTRILKRTYNISTREKAVELGNGPLEKVKISDNFTLEYDGNTNNSSTLGEFHNRSSFASLPLMSQKNSVSGMDLDADSKLSVLYIAPKISLGSNSKQAVQTQLNVKAKNTEFLKTASITLNNNSTRFSNSAVKRRRMQPTSISQMNSLLLQGLVSSSSMRGQWLSIHERELLSAKLRIMNAPIIRKARGLHASLFRNVSTFKRSYDLMERMLKVYIYREGEKPIFHQPQLGGIYASEGWFMKLMEGNEQFVVRDPRKAHLFYLPFSSKMLREAYEQSSPSWKDLEKHLKNYVDLIAEKYPFWNRTEGVDHFFVACHDWASRVTRQLMQNCVRALCNANVAKGFKIGKDTTLPVTSVRKVEDPLRDLGGKPPSQRPILAFFAGNMHGYLRPILRQYWENKEADMKIFGPMSPDSAGKKNYREHMRSSKYCICARGHEVHTPRVVEAIFSECVPVFISDNYVPPFFEVLNWEAFSVFILEKDIPNLRNILLSISKEKYLAMQLRVKMVQKHFLWHTKPVKYDLFHMILHSVWYNRVFQIKTR